MAEAGMGIADMLWETAPSVYHQDQCHGLRVKTVQLMGGDKEHRPLVDGARKRDRFPATCCPNAIDQCAESDVVVVVVACRD